MNSNETKVCVLGFCVGFMAARSFCAGTFRFLDRAFGNRAFSLGLMENLEMDNSLKWVLFIKVSGHITSDML